jgi:hypothetical protein
MPAIKHDPSRVVYSRWEKKPELVARETMEHVAAVHEPVQAPTASDIVYSPLTKRGSIPYLPGNLFCPKESANLTQTDGGAGTCICSRSSITV